MKEYRLEPSAFDRWLGEYGKAWQTGDPDAVNRLFAGNAAYYETPFDEPMVGTDAIWQYWSEGAGKSQKNVRFSYDIISTVRHTGIAHWKATFERIPIGSKVEIDGILMAEFDEQGMCRVFSEWWHRREGG